MSRDNKRRVSFLVSILMILGLVFSNSAFAETKDQTYKKQQEQFLELADKLEQSAIQKSDADRELEETLEQMYRPEDNVRIIVELGGEALSDIYDSADLKELKGSSPLEVSLVNRQDRALAKINTELDREFEVRRRYNTFFSGFSIEGTFEDYKNLKNVRGIKNVHIARVHTLDMNTATKAGNINKIWDEYKFKGEGFVVSIIDTGIDWTHKDMRLSKTTEQVIDGKKVFRTTGAALSMEDIEGLKSWTGIKGQYFTEKIPYGYNFADENTDVIPRDSYHGAHVAGIVGANATDEDYANNDGIRGVAPEVQLLAMKVFSNNPEGAGAYEDDIVAAMEESVKVGADIMNLSLGSTAGFQTDASDLELSVIKKAAEKGILAVISAGNSTYSTFPYTSPLAPDTGLIGSPSIAEYAFTVASAENTVVPTVKGVKAIVDGTSSIYVAQEGRNGILSTLDGTYEIVDCGIGDVKDFEGLQGKLDGKIALIKRGTHYFVHKFLNAKHYGAKGVLLYSDEKRANDIFEVPTGVTNMPVAFISYGDGKQIHDAMEAGKDVKVEFFQELSSAGNPQALMMSDFTSWGPVQNLSLKPEITGFGGNILSTTVNDQYTNMSGTSMASPYVAGSMALILQGMKEEGVNLRETQLVSYLKRVAMNNAVPVVQDKLESLEPITPADYSPRRQGAGLINVEGAIYNKVNVTYNNKPVVELKEIKEETTEFTLKLENNGSTDQTYAISATVQTDKTYDGALEKNATDRTYDIALEGAKLTFNTEKVVVPAGSSKTVTGTLKINEDVKNNVFVEGFIRFTNEDENGYDLSMPYLGFKGEWDKLPIVDEPATSENSMWTTYKVQYVEDGELKERPMYTTQLFVENDNGGFKPFGGAEPKYIGFDPSKFNKVGLIYSLLRNAEYLKVDIVNEAGEVIHTSSEQEYVRKKHSLHYGKNQISSMENIWDGRVYDQSTGERVIAPSDQYYVRVRSKIEMEGAEEQVLKLPIKIDTEGPEVKVLSPTFLQEIGAEGVKLQFTAEDKLMDVAAYHLAIKNYFDEEFKFIDITEDGLVIKDEVVALTADQFNYDEDSKVYSVDIPYTLLSSVGSIQSIGVLAVDEFNNIGQDNTVVMTKIANKLDITSPTASDLIFEGKEFDVNFDFFSNVEATPDEFRVTATLINDDDADYVAPYVVTTKTNKATISSLAAAEYRINVEAVKGEEVLAADTTEIRVISNDIMVKFDNLKSGILLNKTNLNDKNEYEVTGKVYGPLKELRINDEKVTLIGEEYVREFTHMIKFEQGNNTVDIKKVFENGEIGQYGYQVWVDSIMPTLEIKDFEEINELIVPVDQAEYTLTINYEDNEIANLTVNGEVVGKVNNSKGEYTNTIKLEPYVTYVDVKMVDEAENGIERRLAIYRGPKHMPFEAEVEIQDENMLKNGSQVRINATVTNKSGAANNATLLVGIFTDNGRLVNISVIEKNLADEESTKMTSVLSIPTEGEYVIRAYVLDNLQDMNVLSDGIVVNVGE